MENMDYLNIKVTHESDHEATDSDAEFWKDLTERPNLDILENDPNYYQPVAVETQSRPDSNTLTVPVKDRILETCRAARVVEIENVMRVAKAHGKRKVESIKKLIEKQYAEKRA